MSKAESETKSKTESDMGRKAERQGVRQILSKAEGETDGVRQCTSDF